MGFGFDCDTTFIHAYHSLCVRAQLVEVGPAGCQESRKGKHLARDKNYILIRKLLFADFSEADLLDLSMEDDE